MTEYVEQITWHEVTYRVNDLIGLESNGDWDGVVEWAEMPKYKQEG